MTPPSTPLEGFSLATYCVIFRTHIWDDDIAGMAERVRSFSGAGSFVVSCDETRGPIDVGHFTKLSHTDDFAEFGLPRIHGDKSLWWNSDYILYLARHRYPAHDYYVMLEYDVLVSTNLDLMIECCHADGIDFVGKNITPLRDDNDWIYTSAKEMGPEVWWALIPFMVISGRAIDGLLKARQSQALKYTTGELKHWPYCEAFVPTAVFQANLKTEALDTLVENELLRFRPFLSARDERLQDGNFLAHPVLRGERFIRAFLSSEPYGFHVMTDGRFRPELQTETMADLKVVFGNQVQEQRDPEGFACKAGHVPARQGDPLHPWMDLSRGKVATQSSHSVWSRGITAEADAQMALVDEIAGDYAFHTDFENDPWWQVDLLEDYLIESVELVNRAFLQERFRHFRIDVSLDAANWLTCYSKTDNASVSVDPGHPAQLTLAVPVRGRFVRIVAVGHGALHLRHVRVLGSKIVPDLPAPAPSGLAGVLADPASMALLVTHVMGIVDHHVLGRRTDSYDIDRLGFLAAGIESSQYAIANMAAARRFGDAAALHDYAVACTPQEGMILEFGVYSGRSINHIAEALPGRPIHGFDSFEGLPENWRPGFGQGAFSVPELPPVRDNVALIVGWFDKTLPDFVLAHHREKLALLHVDCDLYSSTKTIFHHLADRIVPGTIIIFDEYFNYPEWRQHEWKAFQELQRDLRLSYDYIGLVPGHQQVLVRVTGVG